MGQGIEVEHTLCDCGASAHDIVLISKPQFLKQEKHDFLVCVCLSVESRFGNPAIATLLCAGEHVRAICLRP
eukprot:4252065-Amphidinium_carterae.1